ncbi:hypothetical protein PIROE2DRAFT_63223 [Piromyces sp. E2]|nr:hypothetical protein PIROE2DRAFT_63223 [Piromyces sp. E2]|eukprot:OUM60296.1 hypothetical protein PIROE2DRAFT_63223 [Piromyces sp. E2]
MTWNIMVTGAAGQYGSMAIDYIKKLNPEVKLFGLVHSPTKAESVKAKGVEVRIGDFSDKASLIKAFQVDAAKECGIQYIAYTSINGVDTPKFGLEINHGQTEQWIKESGIPYTFLRNSWYVDLDEGILYAAKNTGRFLYTTSDGKISYGLRREYAEAGAKVILKENNPPVYNFSRTAFTYPELGKAVEEALGKKLEMAEVTMEEFEKYLDEAKVRPFGKSISKNMQSYVKGGNNGEAESTSKDFEEVLGRPLEPLSTVVKEFLEAQLRNY